MAHAGIASSGEVLSMPPKTPLSNDSAISFNISDHKFIDDLKRLKELRSFFIQEGISIGSDSHALTFGPLNQLQYDQNGRAPTEDEWIHLESHTQKLFSMMTEPLRRRFVLGTIPSWLCLLPILVVVLGLGSLVLAAGLSRSGYDKLGLFCYLWWLMSMGAIGSVAFIGMNALSVQQDITFDMSNRKLMVLRITLGALFGVVLTLPFGYQGFVKFVSGIVSNVGANVSEKVFTPQALLLLLPFVLGFSTSAVIVILNRLVDGVQAFFGKTGSTESSARSVSSLNLTQKPTGDN